MAMNGDPEERVAAKLAKKKKEEAGVASMSPAPSPGPPVTSSQPLSTGVKAAFIGNGRLGPRDAQRMGTVGRGVREAFNKRRR
jgi:hypothetical protein